jgi:hypothetical protein
MPLPALSGRPIESFYFSENGIEGLIARDVLSLSLSVDIELSDNVIKKVDYE